MTEYPVHINKVSRRYQIQFQVNNAIFNQISTIFFNNECSAIQGIQ
jgi:hypothetical protein